jgi:hypothetical protein
MERTTFTPLVEAVTDLTERCDRCGAAARLVASLPDGELGFCGHHANAYATGIVRAAVRIRVLAGFGWISGARPSTVDTPPVGAPRSYRNSR